MLRSGTPSRTLPCLLLLLMLTPILPDSGIQLGGACDDLLLVRRSSRSRFGPTAAFHPMMERYLVESLPDALKTMQLTDPATLAAIADILADRPHLIGYALAQMT